MPVNSTHPEYDLNLPAWLRARDVLAGEDAVKYAGERYLPRLEGQSEGEYAAYRARASYFNATARTADGYLGLVFRRPPFIKVPEGGSVLGKAMAGFVNDADMLGTSLADYARNVVKEVVAVGRAGTLVDWEGESEQRVYASLYTAEQILNWRMERIKGRNVLTLLCLHERARGIGDEADEFETKEGEQIRVLKLVERSGLRVESLEKAEIQKAHAVARAYVVEIWRKEKASPSTLSPQSSTTPKERWVLVDRRVPLRFGKPLPLIPFVFHGSSNFLPGVDKLPLADVIAVNLDHYRLDADYKHGMHFTALPTAWVSGFDKSDPLRVGSSTAWVTDTIGAAAGFLEYTGQGLTTFERAMDRDERQMAILGARLLETQKRVGEAAEAIELRQSGENSILGSLAASVGHSLTQVLRWAYWWNSTEALPEDVSRDQVLMELNTDFSTKGLAAPEIVAVVQAWQSGALSRDSMLELFRRGEVLPEGRTNEEEARLIQKEGNAQSQVPGKSQAPASHDAENADGEPSNRRESGIGSRTL